MITTEQKKLLREYADLKTASKNLESEMDILNPIVLQIMQDNEVEEIEVEDLGKVTLASRRSWRYPEAITEFESELKEKKKLAEQLGTATYNEKQYIIFSGRK